MMFDISELVYDAYDMKSPTNSKLPPDTALNMNYY